MYEVLQSFVVRVNGININVVKGSIWDAQGVNRNILNNLELRCKIKKTESHPEVQVQDNYNFFVDQTVEDIEEITLVDEIPIPDEFQAIEEIPEIGTESVSEQTPADIDWANIQTEESEISGEKRYSRVYLDSLKTPDLKALAAAHGIKIPTIIKKIALMDILADVE